MPDAQGPPGRMGRGGVQRLLVLTFPLSGNVVRLTQPLPRRLSPTTEKPNSTGTGLELRWPKGCQRWTPWLELARSVALFGNASGEYDDLAMFLRKQRLD